MKPAPPVTSTLAFIIFLCDVILYIIFTTPPRVNRGTPPLRRGKFVALKSSVNQFFLPNAFDVVHNRIVSVSEGMDIDGFEFVVCYCQNNGIVTIPGIIVN